MIKIMGILNVTPDSFSDGGRFHQRDHALQQAERMIKEGADIIDVGGESTRPGANDVGVQEELDRVIPIIEAIHKNLAHPISIDTSKPEVMEQAILAGATIVNDVRALQEPGALEVCARHSVDICLMHMLGQPRTMQANPQYNDVIAEIKAFFDERIAACEQAGITRNRLILDPGFGFGKTLTHNCEILAKLDQFLGYNLPILAGISRKSMIGQMLGDVSTDQRIIGSVAAAQIAARKGARIIRVHDVRETFEAMTILQTIKSFEV